MSVPVLRILDECRWGPASEAHIAQLRPELQLLCRTVIRVLPRRLDHSLTCSYRGKEAQNLAFETGVSGKRWPESKHNRLPADAFDFRPSGKGWTPKDWNDSTRFGRIIGVYELVGIALSIPIRSGSDWDQDGSTLDEKLRDLAHIEWIG